MATITTHTWHRVPASSTPRSSGAFAYDGPALVEVMTDPELV